MQAGACLGSLPRPSSPISQFEASTLKRKRRHSAAREERRDRSGIAHQVEAKSTRVAIEPKLCQRTICRLVLIRMSHRKRVAIMCAEAVPWRCHRSLVADALSVRGVPVVEILSESSYRMHKLTLFAQVEGVRITYPSEQATLL